MPQGDKRSYTDKQKRQAGHIEDSERQRGRSRTAAERIAWATVNKQDGGGKKSGGGRSTHRPRKQPSRATRTRASQQSSSTRSKGARRTTARSA